MAANPCPALGGGGVNDRDILVIFLILGGMILLISESYAQTHAFSTHFLQIFFLMTFFFASLVEKYQQIPSNGQKSKLLGGDVGQILGGCNLPPGFAALHTIIIKLYVCGTYYIRTTSSNVLFCFL